MKKIFFISALAFSSYGFAQVSPFPTNIDTVLYKNKVLDMELSKDIQGSPYIFDEFTVGRIKDVSELLNIRYNAYKDNVEFKKNDLVYVVPREEKFSTIEIVPTNQFLVFEKYNHKGVDIEGYLFLLSENNTIYLLKKEKAIFKEAERARNTYAEPKPAQFVKVKTEYFVKVDGKIYELPKNKKALIELIPEKKEKIENYFKVNKVNFNNENNLISLFNSL